MKIYITYAIFVFLILLTFYFQLSGNLKTIFSGNDDSKLNKTVVVNGKVNKGFRLENQTRYYISYEFSDKTVYFSDFFDRSAMGVGQIKYPLIKHFITPLSLQQIKDYIAQRNAVEDIEYRLELTTDRQLASVKVDKRFYAIFSGEKIIREGNLDYALLSFF
ncbi:hypothetical protein [Psychrosphaera algicola]|uniref:Uncharacterized protein n=1 Tax=Psychrosphaera algicola TaxID=3023714 RepID=A0ABT5FBZ9_9GAMM|nr:hypothetical protein [Psychrosphaera sp. G1-22]MDC2888564.1 hypothetical protein [Psychrosphaera sp. G1-22]